MKIQVSKEQLLSSPNKLPKLEMKTIKPITLNQKRIFEAFHNEKNLFINGSAGTGKTFVSLYLALNRLQNEIMSDYPQYQSITIIRSAVPARDVGFLPGNLQEKMAVYEHPYRAIVDYLFDHEGLYDELKKQKYIDFMSTSYLRGLTLDNKLVIVDEINNMVFKEMNTIMTRLGENSKIFFLGDFFQSDLKGSNERNGMNTFMSIVTELNEFEHIEMTEDDIVRSKIIKDYIIRMNKILSGRVNAVPSYAIAT